MSLPESRNHSKGANPVFTKSMDIDNAAKTVDIPDISMWKKFLFIHVLLNVIFTVRGLCSKTTPFTAILE